MYDIIIVGAGTAGLSAAIYGIRAGKRVLILEENMYGGRIVNAAHIVNYPGIKEINGFDFASGLYEQAIGLGAEMKTEEVLSIEEAGELKLVKTGQASYESKTVILATGSKNKPLGLAHELEWIGSGISYCATCDGMFYRNKAVAVAGGGNIALEDASYLADYCSKVYIIYKGKAFPNMEQQLSFLQAKPNVEFLLHTDIRELLGKDHLEGLEVEDLLSKERKKLELSGLFVAVGEEPSNSRFSNLVELSQEGYILADEDGLTGRPGIYAAGDCRVKKLRQLITAASDGANSAISACDYINERKA